MRRIYFVIRNIICAILALILLGVGAVRRARRRAFSGDVITALCFHNPSEKLFRQCVIWLTKHGYRFISADDVTDFLNHAKPVPPGAVWVTFDDGSREFLNNVLPLVR